MKERICHFVKWQIHPFISKSRRYSELTSHVRLGVVSDALIVSVGSIGTPPVNSAGPFELEVMIPANISVSIQLVSPDPYV